MSGMIIMETTNANSPQAVTSDKGQVPRGTCHLLLTAPPATSALEIRTT